MSDEERYEGEEEENNADGQENKGKAFIGEEEEEGGAYIDTSGASSTPPPPPPPKERKRRDGFYIIIILMLLIAGGFLGWKLSERNEELNNCENTSAGYEQEIANLNDMMYEQGLDIGDDVEQNLKNMLTMYDKMEVDNQDMTDSIATQKEKIQNLIIELEDAKKDKSYFASKVYKLREETDVLRSIMKDYIRTIDSLNVANGVLTESLEKSLTDLENTQNELNTVTEEKQELSDKVNKGSKLVAFSFATTGIKERSSGSYKETSRANASTHIRSCFTIGDNAIATPGNKSVYMRIIAPTGTVLNSSQSNSFTNEGGQTLLYSDKKTINYQNQATDICIFYKLAEDVEKGNYIAQIYCDGVKIGEDSFVLK